jgi:hypothetical protein
MAKLKIFGLLLMFTAIASFIVNFALWNFWIFENLSFLINLVPGWFWNPLSLLTSRIVGDIPVVSWGLGWVLNYVWAVVWSFALFIVGLILVKH